MGRPQVIVNFAMSVDGKIALPTRRQTKISNQEDMARVHRLRASVDAILVGIGTVLADDPKLTVKEEYAPGGGKPLRIVLDSQGRIPTEAKVLHGDAPTLVVVSEECTRMIPGVEMVRCGKEQVDVGALMGLLEARGIRKLLVEGGEATITAFLETGLVDELKVFIGPVLLGGHASPTPMGGRGFQSLDEAPKLRLEAVTRLGEGVLLEYSMKHGGP